MKGQVQRESAAHRAEAEYRGREKRYQSPSFRPALDRDRGSAERALEDPEYHQQDGRRRKPAAERRDEEPDQADGEYPAPTVPVSESPADHEEDGVGRPVARHDEVQVRRRSAEGAPDRIESDVDAEIIDLGQQHSQQEQTDTEVTQPGGFGTPRLRLVPRIGRHPAAVQ